MAEIVMNVDKVGVSLTGRLIFEGLLLLLAVMNAATLLFTRALDRRQELGVRMALGAGRGRMVRLLVGEAGILSIVGGGCLLTSRLTYSGSLSSRGGLRPPFQE